MTRTTATKVLASITRNIQTWAQIVTGVSSLGEAHYHSGSCVFVCQETNSLVRAKSHLTRVLGVKPVSVGAGTSLLWTVSEGRTVKILMALGCFKVIIRDSAWDDSDAKVMPWMAALCPTIKGALLDGNRMTIERAKLKAALTKAGWANSSCKGDGDLWYHANHLHALCVVHMQKTSAIYMCPLANCAFNESF